LEWIKAIKLISTVSASMALCAAGRAFLQPGNANAIILGHIPRNARVWGRHISTMLLRAGRYFTAEHRRALRTSRSIAELRAINMVP
jgi:hypothetical protein